MVLARRRPAHRRHRRPVWGIRNGKFTREDTEPTAEEDKIGDPYTLFTVRVTNKSNQTVDLSGSLRVTSGPDGEEAEQSYLLNKGSLDGKLIKGKSRSASFTYLIPPKHYGDVVVEVSADFEHESAVFSGSVK